LRNFNGLHSHKLSKELKSIP